MREAGAHPELSIGRQCALLGLTRSTLYYEAVAETAEKMRLIRLMNEQYLRVPFCREGLAKYFGFYNAMRPHQALADRTPLGVYEGKGLGEVAEQRPRLEPQRSKVRGRGGGLGRERAVRSGVSA